MHYPYVEEFAAFLADRAGLDRIVLLDGGRDKAVSPAYDYSGAGSAFEGANPGTRPQWEHVGVGSEGAGLTGVVLDGIDDAVVVCCGVLEWLGDPRPLVRELAQVARRAPFVLLVTPDRARSNGVQHQGPPPAPRRAREWTVDELVGFLCAEGFPAPVLAGFTIDSRHHCAKSAAVVLGGRYVTMDKYAPAARAVAVVTVYNELDVLPEVLTHLLAQGLDVHVVDNWSTDGSYEFVRQLSACDPRISLERFPDKPIHADYEWAQLLDHAASWAAASGYDWIVHNDADELRYSPWPGVTLLQGISFVAQLGFSALDFTVIDFRFATGDSQLEPPYESSMSLFDFGRRPGHFTQIKAWRQQAGVPVDLTSSGGHDATFTTRRVFPLKFLTKHYPLRTKKQAERKIFRDRLPRVAREQSERGWHTQYERFRGKDIEGWDPACLISWYEPMFSAEYLLERLSGIGIARCTENV